MPYPYDLGYPPPEAPVNLYVEPLNLTAGDTLYFRKNLSLYRPSDGWTLSYSLRGVANAAAINFNSTTDGSDFVLTVPAATTAGWAAGRYTVQGYAVNAGTAERHKIFEGFIVVLANLAAVGASDDLRSHAKKTLDLIEATLEGRASDDILDTQIDNTSFRRLTPDQLLLLRDRYKEEVRQEDMKANMKAGRASGRQIYVRFTRPR